MKQLSRFGEKEKPFTCLIDNLKFKPLMDSSNYLPKYIPTWCHLRSLWKKRARFGEKEKHFTCLIDKVSLQ